jgi:hypothetical protein
MTVICISNVSFYFLEVRMKTLNYLWIAATSVCVPAVASAAIVIDLPEIVVNVNGTTPTTFTFNVPVTVSSPTATQNFVSFDGNISFPGIAANTIRLAPAPASQIVIDPDRVGGPANFSSLGNPNAGFIVPGTGSGTGLNITTTSGNDTVLVAQGSTVNFAALTLEIAGDTTPGTYIVNLVPTTGTLSNLGLGSEELGDILAGAGGDLSILSGSVTVVVPEPTTMTAALAGAALMLKRRRR